VLAVNLSFFHRQRAERFAQLLDDSSGARRQDTRSTDDEELTGLADVGRRLSRINVDTQADPEFRTDLRAMLMATIEREGIGASAYEPDVTPEPAHRPSTAASALAWIPIRSRRARGAVVVGLAVGALAVSGISAMSGAAKPGDALYGMKRSGERAQVALSSSQLGRGQLYLEFAKSRMNEAATGRGDVVVLLAEMDDQTRQGVRLLTTAAVERRDPASLDTVDTFVVEQRHTIAGMLEAVAGGARARTIGSLQLLDQITKRVDGLRASLSCGDIASTPADDLGPVPGGCVTQNPSNSSVYRVPTDGSPARDGGGAAPATGAPGAASGSTAVTHRATPASTASAPQHGQPSNDSLLDRIARLLGMD
jgi:hypothetical protein